MLQNNSNLLFKPYNLIDSLKSIVSGCCNEESFKLLRDLDEPWRQNKKVKLVIICEANENDNNEVLSTRTGEMYFDEKISEDLDYVQSKIYRRDKAYKADKTTVKINAKKKVIIGS